MAYNYGYAVSKDRSGYSRRTLSGYIEIPIMRNSVKDRTVPDCVDRLKETVYPPVPNGIRRTTDDWKVSLDRRRADFTLIDEEMPPNPLPIHATDATASHTVESLDRGFFHWQGTIRGSYEVSRLGSRSDSFAMFTTLLKDRLGAVQELAGKNDAGVGVIVPLSLTLMEDITGKKSGEFSCVTPIRWTSTRPPTETRGPE